MIAQAGRNGVLHTDLFRSMAAENPKTGEMVDMKPQACHHLTKVDATCFVWLASEGAARQLQAAARAEVQDTMILWRVLC